MINPGYCISSKDVKELKLFKKSEAYGTYLKTISQSPAYVAIMDEHINNIDITEDMNMLKTEGKLPKGTDPQSIATLFKLTLGRMAIGILADSIVLKELENHTIDGVISGLTADSDVNYLLGQSDSKYYKQALELLNTGKLDQNTLAYKGLVAYTKLHGSDFKSSKVSQKPIVLEEDKLETTTDTTIAAKKAKIDINSDNISI